MCLLSFVSTVMVYSALCIANVRLSATALSASFQRRQGHSIYSFFHKNMRKNIFFLDSY